MAEEYGKIRKSLLTGIADAIRAKKNTTAIFTPEQMAAEIEGIVIGDDLPTSAEYPAIPIDVVRYCPYIAIMRFKSNGSIYAYGSPSEPYVWESDGVKRYELTSGRYKTLFNPDTKQWGEVDYSSTATYCNLITTEILWANYTICSKVGLLYRYADSYMPIL